MKSLSASCKIPISSMDAHLICTQVWREHGAARTKAQLLLNVRSQGQLFVKHHSQSFLIGLRGSTDHLRYLNLPLLRRADISTALNPELWEIWEVREATAALSILFVLALCYAWRVAGSLRFEARGGWLRVRLAFIAWAWVPCSS